MNKPNIEPAGINDDPMAAERESRLANLRERSGDHPEQDEGLIWPDPIKREAIKGGWKAVVKALEANMDALLKERNTAQARVKELEGRMRRCEDCDATMNHIGNGIFECWKCTEAETRAQLVEAQNLQRDANVAFQTMREAGLMAGTRPVTLSNLAAKAQARIAQLEAQLAEASRRIEISEKHRVEQREDSDAVEHALRAERAEAKRQLKQAEAQAATLLPVTEASLKYFEAVEKGASLSEQQRLWLLWDCAVIKYRAAPAPKDGEGIKIAPFPDS